MTMFVRTRNGFPYPFVARHPFLADAYTEQRAGTCNPNRSSVKPRMNVIESDSQYTVHIDMPGVNKQDIQVTVEGNYVAVKAKVAGPDALHDGEKLIFSERTSNEFAREFQLAQELDDERTTARYENGVLTLTLAKKSQAASRNITVQ